MSLYAANNIAKGIARFAGRGNVRLGGIIGNSRNIIHEQALLEAFAKMINTSLITFIPRETIVHQAEINRKTVIEWAPQSSQADVYRQLAHAIMNNHELMVPTPISFEALEELVLVYGNQ